MTIKKTFLLSVLYVLTSSMKGQDDPLAHFNKGNDLFLNKDFKGAIYAFDKALQLDPNLYYVYASRAEAKAELGEFKSALADYNQYKKIIEDLNLLGDPEILEKRQKLISLMPSATDESIPEGASLDEMNTVINSNEALRALYYRAKQKYESGDMLTALRDFTTAISSDSTFVEAWVARGYTQLKLRDIKAAYADFDYALFLKKDHYNALIGRGESKDKLRNYAGAIEDYNAAIQIAPGKYFAYYDRGLTYFNQKNYAKAEEDFGTVIKLNDKHAKAFFNRAVTKVNQRRSLEACLDFKSAQALGHNQAADYAAKICK